MLISTVYCSAVIEHEERTRLAMPTDNPDSAVVFKAELKIGGERVKIEVQLPRATAKAYELVPLLQQLTNKIVEIGIKEVHKQGQSISCSKGCSACCNQLVPVSEPEAHYLMELIASLPEAHRSRIMRRFDDIAERLNNVGLLDSIHHQLGRSNQAARKQLGADYFKLGLACPFLEDDACSIHPHRPMSCREFLVVSSPEYCRENDPQRVAVVNYPRRASSTVYQLGNGSSDAKPQVVPLSLLPEWSKQHPLDDVPQVEVIQYLEQFLQRLAQGAE